MRIVFYYSLCRKQHQIGYGAYPRARQYGQVPALQQYPGDPGAGSASELIRACGEIVDCELIVLERNHHQYCFLRMENAYERNHTCRRERDKAVSADPGHIKAAASRIQQADDILPLVDAYAGKDQRHSDHQHARRYAPHPAAAWGRFRLWHLPTYTTTPFRTAAR